MSYQTYTIVAIILLCFGIFFLLIAAFLFIRFKIIRVIGDLSGSTAKKHIENIRKENISSGDKKFRPSPINVNRGKITEKMTKGLGVSFPGKEGVHDTGVLSQETNLLATPTDRPPNKDSAQMSETVILAGEESESLPESLEGASAGTTVLHAEDGQIRPRPNETDQGDETGRWDEGRTVFEVVRSDMFIHTDEVIL